MAGATPRQPPLTLSAFAVGTPVVIWPQDLRGVVVDVVLNDHVDQILYAIVAFDDGSLNPVIYQPIRWTLLIRTGGMFVVNAVPEALEWGLPGALSALPLSYGGNARTDHKAFIPTPQSVRVH
jgi:hypothetical protein